MGFQGLGFRFRVYTGFIGVGLRSGFYGFGCRV